MPSVWYNWCLWILKRHTPHRRICLPAPVKPLQHLPHPHAWTPSQFKPRDLRKARAHRHEPAETSANEANRKRNVREYTLGEEIANSISHGVGALLAIAAIPILVVKAVSHGGGILLFAALVYTLTMLLEYTMSTLYHALAVDKAKRVFKVLDHSCIYLFIAGFVHAVLLDFACRFERYRAVRVRVGACRDRRCLRGVLGVPPALDLRGALSVALGWSSRMDFCRRCVQAIPAAGLWLLVAGGLCYSGRMHLLRVEEDPVHAFHIPFMGCGGKRAAIPGDCAVCHVG